MLVQLLLEACQGGAELDVCAALVTRMAEELPEQEGQEAEGAAAGGQDGFKWGTIRVSGSNLLYAWMGRPSERVACCAIMLHLQH